MNGKAGLAGIAVALIAISIAVFQDDLRTVIAMDSAQPALGERIIERGRSLFDRSSSGSDHDLIDYSYRGLGFVAIILAVISFLKSEPLRLAAVAAALGIIAIAWQYVLVGVVVAIVILIIVGLTGS